MRTFYRFHNNRSFTIIEDDSESTLAYIVELNNRHATLAGCDDGLDWVVYGAKISGTTYPTYRDGIEAVCNALIRNEGRK